MKLRFLPASAIVVGFLVLALDAGAQGSISTALAPAAAFPPPNRVGISHVTPPEHFRGIYLTSWSAGSRRRIDSLIRMVHTDGVNAAVIDIKDATGFVSYDTSLPAVLDANARRRVIRDLADLVRRLHGEGVYVIARMVVFEDPRLAAVHPELAVHRKSQLDGRKTLDSSTIWHDKRDLAWMDPASKPVWDYNIAIARDALARGVDEINFDYIRFPSDGDLKDMYFPVWMGKIPRREAMKNFFAYLRKSLPKATISADLFGLATVGRDDLGIGQVIEDAYRYFDYVCPMVYPSHFASGFLGRKNPAQYPFEVVSYSMKSAHDRLQADSSANARLRPWLQDFSLGADYDAHKVKAQIRAVEEALGDSYTGFLLWNPLNHYTNMPREEDNQ